MAAITLLKNNMHVAQEANYLYGTSLGAASFMSDIMQTCATVKACTELEPCRSDGSGTCPLCRLGESVCKRNVEKQNCCLAAKMPDLPLTLI